MRKHWLHCIAVLRRSLNDAAVRESNEWDGLDAHAAGDQRQGGAAAGVLQLRAPVLLPIKLASAAAWRWSFRGSLPAGVGDQGANDRSRRAPGSIEPASRASGRHRRDTCAMTGVWCVGRPLLISIIERRVRRSLTLLDFNRQELVRKTWTSVEDGRPVTLRYYMNFV